MADMTEKNRSHWNEASNTYNSRFSKTIQQIIDEIQARKDWIGVDWVEDDDDDDDDHEDTSPQHPKRTVRLLDYACGTGLVSRALAAYVTQCVGIDISEGMVEVYNASAKNQGISEYEMHATVGNLIDPKSPSLAHFSGPEAYDFDLVVVGLGFHHFDDPPLAAKMLAERLKPGGVLMIVDFLPHEHFGGQSHGHSHKHGGEDHGHGKEEKPHAAAHTVTHMGFSEEQVKSMFEAAGVGKDFDYVVVGKGIVFTTKSEGHEELKRSLFMARGVKL